MTKTSTFDIYSKVSYTGDKLERVNEMTVDDVNFELEVSSEEARESDIFNRWEDMMFEMYQRLSVDDSDLYYDIV